MVSDVCSGPRLMGEEASTILPLLIHAGSEREIIPQMIYT